MASVINKVDEFTKRLDDFVEYWLSEGITIPEMILELDLARQAMALDELVKREEARDVNLRQ